MKNANLALAILTIIFVSGCADPIVMEDSILLTDTYTTIRGLYDVRVVETEDSCDPSTDAKDHIDQHSWLLINQQEEMENGNIRFDFTLSDLFWPDVVMTPDGNFENNLDIYENEMFINHLSGNFQFYETESGFGASVEADVVLEMNFYETSCNVVYEISGYQMMQMNPPPEDIFE